MAGGSPDHAALAASIIRLLGPQLPPGCRAFTSDLRLRVPTTGLSTYPDVAVVCGPTERAADDAVAVVNPVLLVEVTSHATEEYDSGQKLEHYQHLPSVRAILIVSHREPHLTLHRRDETGWVVIEARQQRDIALAAVQARLSVDDVYRDGLEDVSQ